MCPYYICVIVTQVPLIHLYPLSFPADAATAHAGPSNAVIPSSGTRHSYGALHTTGTRKRKPNEVITFRNKHALKKYMNKYVETHVPTLIQNERIRANVISNLGSILETHAVPMLDTKPGVSALRQIFRKIPQDLFLMTPLVSVAETVAYYNNKKKFIGLLYRCMAISNVKYDEKQRKTIAVVDLDIGDIVGVQPGRLALASAYTRVDTSTKYYRDVMHLGKQCIFDASYYGFSPFNELLPPSRIRTANVDFRVDDDAVTDADIPSVLENKFESTLVFHAIQKIPTGTAVIA